MNKNNLNIDELEALIAHSDNKDHAFLLFREDIELLKNHTFIFLDNNMSNNTGNKIPDFMNKVEDGICVTTLSNEDGCFILNKETVLETIKRGTADLYLNLTYRLDVQMMNYLLGYYEGKKDIPAHFVSILKRCDKKMVGFDCTPYLFENGSKIYDPKIEAGVLKCYLPFVRFLESGLKKFSVDYPFYEQEYLQAKETIDLLKKQYANTENELIFQQQYIYAILLKTVIIYFSSKSQIKKKILELLEFANKEMGLYFERELAICYWFLKDRNDSRICRFFKDIQIGSKKDILNTLGGMAWDLFHLRSLMTSMYIGENIQENNSSFNNIVHIDSLVTQDKGLTNIIKAYPIRCIIYKNGDIMPKVVWKDSITKIVQEVDVFDNFYSNLESRHEVFKNTNLDVLIQQLEETLNSILSK